MTALRAVFWFFLSRKNPVFFRCQAAAYPEKMGPRNVLWLTQANHGNPTHPLSVYQTFTKLLLLTSVCSDAPVTGLKREGYVAKSDGEMLGRSFPSLIK